MLVTVKLITLPQLTDAPRAEVHIGIEEKSS